MLLKIINRSWRESRTPAAWRTVLMIGIPKSNDSKTLRPISLSSLLSRVSERLVNIRLIQIAEKAAPPCQPGFRFNRNTVEQVGALAQRVDTRTWKGVIAALFTDFSAAYDRVIIPALLHKLYELGADPALVAWFVSFLTDRRAHRRKCNTTGRSYVLACGLPQGGSPSPVLWNIYIADLDLSSQDEHCDLEQLGFADDTSFHANGGNWEEV